jgi:hypothetical protein
MKINQINNVYALLMVAMLVTSSSALAQDGKMYDMKAPDESNAIPLNTGGVEGQCIFRPIGITFSG